MGEPPPPAGGPAATTAEPELPTSIDDIMRVIGVTAVYVAKQDIRVAYLGTDYNVADFFTKGLTNPKFKDFRNMLGLRSLVSRPMSHFMSFLGLTFGI